MSWQAVTSPALRTTAPIDELSKGAPSTSASPRTTTRPLTPTFRGCAGGFAVGGGVVEFVRFDPLLLVHPVAAVSDAIIRTHPNRRSRLIGARACTDKSAPGALVTLPLLRPQLNAVKPAGHVYEL